MNGPRIENSDRGFTVSKSLGWTMAVGLISAGLYLGGQLQGTHKQQEMVLVKLGEIEDRQQGNQARSESARAGLDARLRAVETTRAADNAEIIGLRRDLGEFRAELRQVITELRREVRP